MAPGGPESPNAPSNPQSSTALLERTEVEREKDPGDGDRFAHFVRKDKADSSMMTGQPVVAFSIQGAMALCHLGAMRKERGVWPA